MPGFHTHYFFGQQVKNKPARYEKSYAFGLQGPDIFFHTISAHLLYGKNIGTVMHDNDTGAFFEALLKLRRHIKTKDAADIADSYIKGFMAHYTLDTVVHPYVYARTKHLSHPDRKSYDFGIHVFLETDMDNAVTRHFAHLKPTEFKPWETIGLSPKEKTVITYLLYRAIKEVYPKNKVLRGTVLGATRAMYRNEFLMHDKKGRRKYLVRFFEDKVFGHAVVSSMIPSDNFRLYKDPCNLRHLKWHNPWQPDDESTESICDMIDRATDSYRNRLSLYKDLILRQPENYFYCRNSLLTDLGNKNYDTGLEIPG